MATCKKPECKKEIYFLYNTKTGKFVPVDAESMNETELEFAKLNGHQVEYDAKRHVSHFKTCTAPNDFSSRGEKQRTSERK